MIDERELIVRRCGFLHGLQLDEVEAFLGYGRAHQAAAGIYLFHQDDPADLFYILRQGQIRPGSRSRRKGIRLLFTTSPQVRASASSPC